MLYWLADIFDFRLFQYLTFRAGLAVLISLIITLVFGKKIINLIKKMQIIEKQRILGLPGEEQKAKTPTMGGLMILFAILVPCLLLADLSNIYIQLMLLTTLFMGLVGFWDDYLKLTKGKDGLAGRYKILAQVILGAIVGSVMIFNDDVVVRVDKATVDEYGYEIVRTVSVERLARNSDGSKTTYIEDMYHVKTTITNVPFLKGNEFDYKYLLWFLGEKSKNWVWIIFIPIIIIIMVNVSNAANLTDGIDGLAAGTSAIIGAVLGLFAYVSGNNVLAEYLGVLYVPDVGELVVFSACFLGACIGFLWFNAYPAEVFMGDTGSLALGGIIAGLAIMIRKELLIPLLCGIFVIENLSVIMQVSYFKYTRKKTGTGKRIFLMSPLHHHYQKKGMHESKIVSRFWIVGVFLAVLTIITLKVR
jgi:phospho-N-acetylmuramoyl-pentapeptide-transferase